MLVPWQDLFPFLFSVAAHPALSSSFDSLGSRASAGNLWVFVIFELNEMSQLKPSCSNSTDESFFFFSSVDSQSRVWAFFHREIKPQVLTGISFLVAIAGALGKLLKWVTQQLKLPKYHWTNLNLLLAKKKKFVQLRASFLYFGCHVQLTSWYLLMTCASHRRTRDFPGPGRCLWNVPKTSLGCVCSSPFFAGPFPSYLRLWLGKNHAAGNLSGDRRLGIPGRTRLTHRTNMLKLDTKKSLEHQSLDHWQLQLSPSFRPPKILWFFAVSLVLGSLVTWPAGTALPELFVSAAVYGAGREHPEISPIRQRFSACCQGKASRSWNPQLGDSWCNVV